jgi:anti-sigma factor RsiW
MSCTDIRATLSELADGSLSGEARARAEEHLATCDACRAALADIRRIRQAARSLPKMAPPEDLWDRVRSRIEAETASPKVVSIEPYRRWLPSSHRTWSALAAAAVLFVAVGSGIVFMLQRSQPAPPSQVATAPVTATQAAPTTASAHAGSANLVESVEMELQQAESHYEKAIAGLEQVAREGQSSLDPQTAAVLQKNLGILDQAVRESRSALKAQPTSEPAQVSLFEALRRKVELLQDTVSLINEMRKGNQAGAARIVGGNK